MAGRQKPKKIPPKRKRRGWRAGAAACALLALGVGAMHLGARTVHVRYANVALEDLPASFDGTTVLFASDFDLCGLNTAADVERLFDQLQPLKPDLLLLGGDYASASLLERLNGRTGADETAARKEFFAAVADFHAPLGKVAVSGDNDGGRDALLMSMMGSGVQLIDGGVFTVSNGTDEICIVGAGENTSNLSQLAGAIRSDACAIALMHRPAKVVDVRIAEAKGGGQWADLSLAGHTHGGQLQVAGRTLLSLNETEKRCLAGWYSEGGPLLVTSGVGCEGVNLRLGSQAEVWMITLKCK